VRIYKQGATQPITAKIAEATDDKLVYVVKNSQNSMDRKDIGRIDFRPPVKSQKTETHSVGMDDSGLNETWGSSTSWSRDGWQTVYQKPSR
jgi:hypothetical protein